MNKRYQPAQHEPEMYQLWQKHRAFDPDQVKKLRTQNKQSSQKKQNKKNKQNKQSYCIIMPPPNANDPLHIGHAMFVSLEDAMIRFHRMLGDDTLWLPGTDHAGIETQYVFEKKLKKKNESRFQYDRKTLYQKIWDYVQENKNTAVDQIKKLGASADWSREKFTLDPDIIKDVLATFKKLDTKGLIYRANRLVNYCTKCGTAFSELEVAHTQKKSPLYFIKYGPLTVATTRPETKFADVALAFHPQDERYQQYQGQTLKIKGLAQTYHLPVIADKFVDPEFGTGIVKITPYHDHNDFAFWKRHQDEIKQPPQKAIDFAGRLTKICPKKYQGLKTHIARQQLVDDLKNNNLLKDIKQHTNKISTCYRCKRPIEPLPLTQFYIKIKPLVEPVLQALENNTIQVYGAGHDKILKHWLQILKDWNISRQIVWGIRLPVWYDCHNSNNQNLQLTFVDKLGDKITGSLAKLNKKYSLAEIKQGLQELKAPLEASYTVSQKPPGNNYLQETDTFDTWFSSSQWPVVALKNNKPHDFSRFYPTQIMETAYDILMFWVMRMLMMGKFVTGKFPFKTVYLHGLIRDDKGDKMSKSKGNVINPLKITQKYGTDALRMALMIRSNPGLDKSVGHPDFKAARNLSNKMWNATRYILLNLEEDVLEKTSNLPLDREFRSKLLALTKQITRQLQTYKLGLAAETLYNEFWHWFCDECIEASKNKQLSQKLLLEGLKTFLKMFHPFMPFITEKLWQILTEKKLTNEPLLIVANWPNQ